MQQFIRKVAEQPALFFKKRSCLVYVIAFYKMGGTRSNQTFFGLWQKGILLVIEVTKNAERL